MSSSLDTGGRHPHGTTLGSSGKKISTQDIQKVQNLIEKCLQLYMPRKEVALTLERQAKVPPRFTALVWQKLEEQNPDFFKAYYLRLKVNDQVMMFNYLLDQQVKMVTKLHQSWLQALPSLMASRPGMPMPPMPPGSVPQVNGQAAMSMPMQGMPQVMMPNQQLPMPLGMHPFAPQPQQQSTQQQQQQQQQQGMPPPQQIQPQQAQQQALGPAPSSLPPPTTSAAPPPAASSAMPATASAQALDMLAAGLQESAQDMLAGLAQLPNSSIFGMEGNAEAAAGNVSGGLPRPFSLSDLKDLDLPMGGGLSLGEDGGLALGGDLSRVFSFSSMGDLGMEK